MTTTPTLWLAEQQANLTDAGTPGDDQTIPKLVGLPDGTFVAFWESNADGGPDAGAAGTDIIGQLYDAEGNRIGAEFRANQSFFADSEGNFDAAALPNGNVVIAYEDTDSNGTAIRYTVLTGTGSFVSSGTIASDPGAATLGAPSVSVASDGSFLVAFQQNDGSGNPVSTSATIVNSAGVAGSPFLLLSGALGTGGIGLDTAVTTLTNGNHVIVGRVSDGDTGFYMRIVDPTGGSVLGFTEVTNTIGNGQSDSEPSVTALAGGGFVVAWTNFDGTDTDVVFQIYSAGGAAVGGQQLVNGSAVTNFSNEPDVVGLPDGGFVVLYDDDSTDSLSLQRYDSNGAAVGSVVTVASALTESAPSIALTADGRLLVGWTSTTGSDADVAFAIYDPRESSYNGTGGNDVLTSRIEGSTVNGLGGADTLLGQDGADRLIGGDGSDSIRGGDGDDLIEGGFDGDSITGQIGNDTIFAMTQADEAGSGVGDTILGGAGDDSLFGSTGADILQGNGDNDFLRGGAGADTLQGGGGTDTVAWGTNQIVAGEVAAGGAGTSDRILIEGNVLLNQLGANLTGFEEIEFDAAILSVKTVTLRADQLGAGVSSTALVDGALIGFADVLRVTMASDTDLSLAGLRFTDWNSAAGEGDKVVVTGDADAETITGSAERDIIDARGGNDTLTGGGGLDRLLGGDGDDIYIVDAAKEAVESPGQGTDLVRSSVSYTLGTSIENLKLTGVGGSNGTGNDLGNAITGNGSANVLNGLAGIDVLTGGAGADRFVFSTALGAANVDTITDFASVDDTIRLDDAIFTALAVGALPGGAFRTGAQAADAGDRIIYNDVTGNLFYDEDGAGGAAQVRFARLDPGLTLVANDFVVV